MLLEENGEPQVPADLVKGKSTDAKSKDGKDKHESKKDDRSQPAPKELPAGKGEGEESKNGNNNSKNGNQRKKGDKRGGGKSNILPLLESEDNMDFEDITKADRKKRKVSRVKQLGRGAEPYQRS